MGFLKQLRSKSKLKDSPPPRPTSYEQNYPVISQQPRRDQPDLTASLPDRLLARIFAYVCPHSRDLSFIPSEQSQIGDGCALCDLRDLAHCGEVCRRWYSLSQGLLYRSVRIDAVHYCDLEEELTERRKKAAKFRSSKNTVEPVDVPHVRLQLLCRSVRENATLAELVQILKLPYMTRETAKGDLARTVSALTSLRYVDLPDGFYSGDPSCLALRQELQVRCPDIRKMTYQAGAEEALELLAQRHWPRLEILQLHSLAVEPATLRIVLASLPALQDLTITSMNWVDDTIFQSSSQLPEFPPLSALTLVDMPNVTGEGLKLYLQAPINREALVSLSLKKTGVGVTDLPQVLWVASNLLHLSITENVSKSLGLNAQDLPPLTSISLKTLHFEIMSSGDVHGLQKPADSYYSYLASSLHRNALPGVESLYVRDQHFPDLLLTPPRSNRAPNFLAPGSGTRPAPSEAGSLRSKSSDISGPGFNNSNHYLSMPDTPVPPTPAGFSQKLEVFAKGSEDVEWVFTSVAPPVKDIKPVVRGGRAVSEYVTSKGQGPQWAQGGFGGDARKSVVVGNGFGGFLALPQEEMPRPLSESNINGPRWGSTGTGSSGQSSFLRPPPSMASLSGSEKRNSKHDLWR